MKFKMYLVLLPLLIFKPLVAQEWGLRILGGETVKSDTLYPWMAALVNVDTSSVPPDEGQFCGGTLIASDWVVTAAHCITEVAEDDSINIGVLLGVLDLSNTENENNPELIPVDFYVIHPDWELHPASGLYGINDIALLHLSNSTNKTSLPLIYNSTLCDSGVVATVLGYSGTPADSLKQANISIQSGAVCENNEYFGDYFSQQYHLCTQDPDSLIQPTTGDSGGPMMVPDSTGSLLLAGIISWGLTAQGGIPPGDRVFAYTRVDSHLVWINQYLNSVNIVFRNEYNYFDIGDSLTISGNSHGTEGFERTIVSGDSLLLPLSEQFTVTTNIETTQWNPSTTIKHHRWNTDNSEFRLSYDFAVLSHVNQQVARFEEIDSVRIVNHHGAQMSIKDPWYVENGQQNNQFHVLTDSTYDVFLNQDPESGNQFYALRTIEYYGTDSLWFDRWAVYNSTGVEDTVGDWAELATPSNHDSCMVIFKQEHARVKALYTDVSGAPVTPSGFAVDCSGGNPVLTWSPNSEKDLSHYKVYYQYYSGRPSQQWFYYTTTDTTWTDDNVSLGSGSDHARYKVAAVDAFNNESGSTGYGQCDGDVGTWPARQVSMTSGEIPEKYSLEAPYPNPFNPSVTIVVAVPENADNVYLSVYDIGGREVERLHTGALNPGYHSFVWNGETMPGGIYLVKMTTREYSHTGKVILLK